MWVRILILLGLMASFSSAADPIHVSAAMSLKEVMTVVGAQYEKQSGTPIKFTFHGSAEPTTQTADGADVDVFISANPKQVNHLIEKGAADKATRLPVCTNELVLITPPNSTGISAFENLADEPVKRIALADPKTAAGEYSVETLKSLKLFDKIESKCVQSVDERHVLESVRKGEVEAGLVYRTDAMIAKDTVRVAAVADGTWHAPIEYAAVCMTSSKNKEEAAKFLEFLRSEPGQAEICKRGFATTTPAAKADLGK